MNRDPSNFFCSTKFHVAAMKVKTMSTEKGVPQETYLWHDAGLFPSLFSYSINWNRISIVAIYVH